MSAGECPLCQAHFLQSCSCTTEELDDYYKYGSAGKPKPKVKEFSLKIERKLKAREVESWPEYYMGLAKKAATRSKDPSTQVGCQITTSDNEPLAIGYNGSIKGFPDSIMVYDNPLKQHLTLHAEINAISHAKQKRADLYGCIAYITHGPCDNCLMNLLKEGIRTIYYDSPCVMRDRGSDLQKQAIYLLILGTSARVRNVNNGKSYLEELGI